MTLEEKREKIRDFCYEHACTECALYEIVRDNENCHLDCSDNRQIAPNIERNYKILFGSDEEPEAKVEKTCSTCKHFHLDEDSEPCISCNSYCIKWEPAEEEKTKESEIITSVEEMNEVIQEHCREHCCDCLEDYYRCPIDDLCDMVGGNFLHNPNECNEAYNILMVKTTQTSDAVNHPAHYQGKHECIDEMIAIFGKHAVMDFCRCNVYKYRYRAAAKNGQEDLDKANWYMDKLIELQKGEKREDLSEQN